MGKPLFAVSGYRVRSIASERAAVESRKPFDPRKLEVKSLEFWGKDDKGKAKKLKDIATKKTGYTARETVLAHLDKLPAAQWHWGVVEYKTGERMSTGLPGGEFADLAELDRKLTNSNAYSSPNFDIDTSTNVAGLTALKGSAPATTDNIFVFKGATLTIESACAWNMLSIGETSAGACASAGDRVGHLTINANVTFAGNATSANSGIKSVPASAVVDPSGTSILTIAGTSGAYAAFTNAGDAPNSSQRWAIVWTWGGTPLVSYASFRFSYGSVLSSGCLGGTNCNAYTGAINIHHVKVYGTSNATFFLVSSTGADLGVEDNHRVQIELWDQTGAGGTANLIGFAIHPYFTTGSAEARIDRFMAGAANQTGTVIPLSFDTVTAGDDVYFSSHRVSAQNIAPTEIVPTTLAAAPTAGVAGSLTVTWANGAAYKTGELIVVKLWKTADGEGAATYRFGDATAGTFAIPGLDAAEHTLKAYATTDNYVVSAYTATTTGTPTAPAGGSGGAPVFGGHVARRA